MKTVLKVIVKNNEDYLMMYRSDHPTFGIDPDLPGGIMEQGESSLDTLLREVEEEIGLILTENQVRKVYEGDSYSARGTVYVLYLADVLQKPSIKTSWEHSSFEWLSKTRFVSKAYGANDTYMHMSADILRSTQ
jgi:8-oxo-dGTP pyrophosphatase MutT (NUDIX family)